MGDRYDRTKRFAEILMTTRYKSKVSQERMAAELGVSKKTIQNWEKGTSIPNFLQCVEWFETVGVNPLSTMCRYFHSEIQNAQPETQDLDVELALNTIIGNLPIEYKRSLLYVLGGDHGSSVYALLQLLVAHLHTPMRDRITPAITIVQMYDMEKMLDNLVCKNNVMPDEDALKSAIQKAIKAVADGKFGYVNDVN